MPPKEPRIKESHLLNPDGSARDLWPEPPTREECVEVGFPTEYHSFTILERLWAALTIEEKEALGFTRVARAAQIERLIHNYKKGKSHDR